MDRPDPSTLRRLYVDEKKTLAEIASPLGVSPALVRKWLLRAGIPTRSKAEARAIAKQPIYTEAQLAAMRLRAANARTQITTDSRAKQSETRKRLRLGGHNKGVPMSEAQRLILIEQRADPEYRRKMSERFMGEKSPSWKGGQKPEHSRRLDRAEWRRLRKVVYERDNWTCQDCRCKCLNTADSKSQPKRKIQAHHVIPRRHGGRDEIENLVTLCMSCHHKRERAADAALFA